MWCVIYINVYVCVPPIIRQYFIYDYNNNIFFYNIELAANCCVRKKTSSSKHTRYSRHERYLGALTSAPFLPEFRSKLVFYYYIFPSLPSNRLVPVESLRSYCSSAAGDPGPNREHGYIVYEYTYKYVSVHNGIYYYIYRLIDIGIMCGYTRIKCILCSCAIMTYMRILYYYYVYYRGGKNSAILVYTVVIT